MRAAVFTRSPMTRPSSGGLGRGGAAGHDPDPGLEVGRVLGAVGGDGRDELEAGPHRPLGVVLLRDRGAPDRHDGVADELLDDAAVAGDDGPGELEVTGEELSYLLGVSLLRERREADEVAEQHRDVAELGGRRGGPLRWLEPCRAGAAGSGSEAMAAPTGVPQSPQNRSARLELRPARGADGRPTIRRSPCRTACRPGSRLHTLGSASVPSSACPKATTPWGGLYRPGQ